MFKPTESRIQDCVYWRYLGSSRVIIPNYHPRGWQECDVYVVTKAGYGVEHEIKLSKSDFKAEFDHKGYKHRRLLTRDCVPTRFYFWMPEDVAEGLDVPEYAGLILFRVIDRRIGRIRVAKPAPRLNSNRLDAEAIADVYRAISHRYWHGRFRARRFRQERDDNYAYEE